MVIQPPLQLLAIQVVHSCVVYFYINSGSSSVLKQLAGGVLISSTSSRDLIPKLTTFSAIFQIILFALHDAEFYGDIAGKLNF